MRNGIIVLLTISLGAVSISVARAASDSTPAIAPETGGGFVVPNGGTKIAASIQLRVYNAGVVPAADETAALRAAATVLAGAGIGSRWLTCGEAASGTTSMACNTPLQPSELSVRFVNLPGTPLHGELSLGYSLVDTSIGAGQLATIYVDRVRWLAEQTGADAPALIGFATAHEVGHLLLGTNAHGDSGLMRAVWSRAELQRRAAADWVFAPSEAARMRTSLLRREGLRSSQHNSHATGCSAPLHGASDVATGATGCHGGAFASIRRVAAGADR